MKRELIEQIKEKMTDTEDPKVGSVFEKQVEVDFATFCAFVLTQWNNVTMEVEESGSESMNTKSTVYLFYNGPGAFDHIASYIINPTWKKPHGVFGGSRIGSQNQWLKPGDPLVKNAFYFN